MAINQYDNIQYAQYKPISMQEMWAPAQEMRQQHDKLQEEYAQQEQQGGLSLLGIDPVKDKAAYDIQQNYLAKTKAAADELATKGFIDSGRRRGLMEVKSLYTNQVVPLQNQLAIRNARAEELRKIQLSDPTFRANASPSDVSLTEGLKSPTAFDYTGVSGNQLQSSVAKKAEQLGKTISQDHPELIHSKLFGQYFTALQSGASLAQVDNAMRKQFDPAKVDKMTGLLHGLVSSTLNEFGVPDKFKNNQVTQDELWGTAAQGLYSAIGSKQFGQMTDSFAIDARKKALENKGEGSGYLQDIQIDPELTQNPRFSKNESIIKFLQGNKYSPSTSSANKEAAIYDKAVREIKANKNMSAAQQAAAISGIARAEGFNTKSSDYENSKQVEALAKRFKTTDTKEIAKRLGAENEMLKVAVSQHGISSSNNYALENVLGSISNYNVDISELKNDKGEVNRETTKVYMHPTKGLVLQGLDKKGKVVIKTIPSDILGNPAVVREHSMITLPKLTKQILDGNVDVNSMIQSGELINDPQNKGYYIFANPTDGRHGSRKLTSSYTKEELNDAIYHPEIMQYLNERQANVFNQFEARLQGQNKGYDVKPK